MSLMTFAAEYFMPIVAMIIGGSLAIAVAVLLIAFIYALITDKW